VNPSQPRIGRRQVGAATVVLGLLSVLEIAAHVLKGSVGVVACRLWILHGCVAVGWLCAVSLREALGDARTGRLWVLLPVLLAVPLCFFNTRGFGALNSESLSELQFAFERLRQPDWGYTDVFWEVYPSRSLLPNMVPTLLGGISPRHYRIGFSIPVFLGVLFFYAGLRRYLRAEPWAAPLSALGAAAMLTYPFVIKTTRTFEMAVSSFAYGLWALGALLLCVSRPTLISILGAAWTAGLLAASFTSGLALVALIWSCIGLWLVRCVRHKQWDVAVVVAALLVYLSVVGGGIYAIRKNPLQPKPASATQMTDNFVAALRMVASVDQSVIGNVFTPAILVFPTMLVVGYALSGRAGILPLLGVLWCFPAIWATVNLHGKIGPLLPFALYRAIVIVPVLVFCMVHLGAFMTSGSGLSGSGRWRGVFAAAAGGLALSAFTTYKSLGVFQPLRPPVQAEAVIRDLVEHLNETGLTPFSDAVIVEKTGDYELHRIRPLSWYFLPGWTRPGPTEPLFVRDPKDGRPGIVFVLPGDPLINEKFEGYDVQAKTLAVPQDATHTREVVRLLYVPKRRAAPE
jgi:hypothetical protein